MFCRFSYFLFFNAPTLTVECIFKDLHCTENKFKNGHKVVTLEKYIFNRNDIHSNLNYNNIDHFLEL